MTLLELCETCGHIHKLDITVRNQNTERLNEYIICPEADKIYYAVPDSKRVFINKPVHVQQNGAPSSMFGFVSKSLPKELRDLEVTHWRVSSSWGRPVDDWSRELVVDVEAAAPLSIKQEITVKEEDGQMNFDEVTI